MPIKRKRSNLLCSESFQANMQIGQKLNINLGVTDKKTWLMDPFNILLNKYIYSNEM